jgi:hypothetical protein
MMKKQILLLFGLLLSHFVYSQVLPVGYYHADITGWVEGDSNHNCGEAFVNLEFQKGAVRLVTVNYGEYSPKTNFNNSYEFEATNILNAIYFSASRQINESCNGDRPNNQGRKYDGLKCLDFSFAFADMINVNEDRSGLWHSDGNIKVFPKLKIVDNSTWNKPNYFEIDDPVGIKIDSHTGFDPSEYNWEYLLPSLKPSDTPKWSPFTNLINTYNGLSSITLKIKDIIAGVNPKQYYGKTLAIRQKGCVDSEPVSYTMVKTPPLLVSTTPPEKTKCSYSTDGKIQFTFNRPLETSVVDPLLNETFLFNLKRYNPITGLYDKSDVVSYDVVNTATNSQCTLKNLPPGKYQATYQTVFPNDQNAGTTLNSELKNL